MYENSPQPPKRYHGKPPRLDLIFQRYQTPLFFVTFNTHNRIVLLANVNVHAVFCEYAQKGSDLKEAYVGRYVIMPDHVHLFVTGSDNFDLGIWVRGLKRALSKVLPDNVTHWQTGFFDHLMRSDESYAEKWDYVRLNPHRAGLVSDAHAWPFQGEINVIDRI